MLTFYLRAKSFNKCVMKWAAIKFHDKDLHT